MAQRDQLGQSASRLGFPRSAQPRARRPSAGRGAARRSRGPCAPIPRATARRRVTCLSPTSTMRTAPEPSSTWESSLTTAPFARGGRGRAGARRASGAGRRHRRRGGRRGPRGSRRRRGPSTGYHQPGAIQPRSGVGELDVRERLEALAPVRPADAGSAASTPRRLTGAERVQVVVEPHGARLDARRPPRGRGRCLASRRSRRARTASRSRVG